MSPRRQRNIPLGGRCRQVSLYVRKSYSLRCMCTQNLPHSSLVDSVFYITLTCTSSTQELIMQGIQLKLEKSCFRCKKNTCHVESNHILQPRKYLIIIDNRFRYRNNNKDRCPIPMNMTVVLGLHTFSLPTTVDHHGPYTCSGHYAISINCWKNILFNGSKITAF